MVSKISTWVRNPLGRNIGLCHSISFHLHSSFKINCLSTSTKANLTDPLGGIRVIDLTRIVAGPYCTMVLGDLGAEVLKVEKPWEGDECRKWGPPFIPGSSESCYFVCLNRNKKSLCVDLKTEEGKQILFDLSKLSDVLVENYVPGKLDEMGLGYEDFRAVAPHLIYCSVSGFGSEGLYKERPGYDVIAASIGGLLHITGPKGGEPCKVGVAMTDIMTGLYAHGAIMAALLQRAHTGCGQKIDANLLSTQLSSLINIGSNYLNTGQEAVRHGTSHPSIVPYEALLTSDGKYITVGAGSDQQFATLCKRFGLPDIIKDKRFASNKQRVANRDELMSILKERFSSKPSKEWLQILDGASFPYGPVNTLAEEVPAVRLKLRKPKSDKKVQWDSDTVDNEHLNKRRSKCCCIYKKPRAFGESSSSESEDECENCYGHKKKILHKSDGSQSPSAPVPCGSGSVSSPHTQDLHSHSPDVAASSSRKGVGCPDSLIKSNESSAAGRERSKSQMRTNERDKKLKRGACTHNIKRRSHNRERLTMPSVKTNIQNRTTMEQAHPIKLITNKKEQCSDKEVTCLRGNRDTGMYQPQNMRSDMSRDHNHIPASVAASGNHNLTPNYCSEGKESVNSPPSSKKKRKKVMCIAI